jgi:addiction module RelE/StbE family toxin
MAGDGPIRIVPIEGFREKYRALARGNPAIAESIKTFNEVKRRIPPEALPGGMKDHKLKGRYKHLRECHLAPNALLIYSQNGNLITLHDIWDHDTLK